MKNQARRRYVVITLLFTTWMVGYLDRLAINTAIIPIAKEFSLNEVESGLILSAFFLSYTLMQLIGGWLADRFDVRWLILLSVIVWSLFTGLTGLATSFLGLILIRILFGVGEGTFPSASTVIIIHLFQPDERARAKTSVLSGTTAGTLLGTFVSASLILSVGWRGMFYLLGLLGTILVLCFCFMFQDMKPQSVPLKKHEPYPFQQIFRSPMLVYILSSWFCWNIVLWGMNSWMPSYWVKVRGLNLMEMGTVSIIPALAGMIGMIGSGWVLDRWLKGRESLLGAGAAIVACISLLGLLFANSDWIALLFQTVVAFCGSCVSATIFVYPIKYVAQQIAGSVTGLINFGGMAAAAISPTIFGYLVKITAGSYQAGFLFFMTAAFLSGLSTWLIRTDQSLLFPNSTEEKPLKESS
ncbi:Sugar phosphate permease [Seinonella peptonophila]|uniref:Sugar phosphate permease n=1 Tax=Seinonella peptonophila TaxID=112248 RepID=A0A1M4XHX4_9BACL|nr:MFS transporter [Seinonella peptonophila]SHE92913.1 Sugar phosphate permease [Seinonella peptonophila]